MLAARLRGVNAAEEVEVWWVATGRLGWRRLVPLLDPGERTRLAALRREQDQERFVLAAALARGALAQRLAVPAADIRLDRRCARCGAPHGRPRLLAPPAPMELSITHSGHLVGVAVARAAVGLDVEFIDGTRGVDEVARSVLTAHEHAALERFAGDDGRERLRGFLRLWTRKEALTKMVGRGLNAPLQDIEVSGPSEPARLRSWAGSGDLVERVSLVDLDPPVERHVGALAALAPGVAPVQGDGEGLVAPLAP